MLKILLFILPFSVMAHDHHGQHEHTINYYDQRIINEAAADSRRSGDIATSNAIAGIDCTYTTERWMAMGSIGFHDGTLRPAVGLCKKVNKTLIKFSYSRDSGEDSGNVAVGIPFN